MNHDHVIGVFLTTLRGPSSGIIAITRHGFFIVLYTPHVVACETSAARSSFRSLYQYHFTRLSTNTNHVQRQGVHIAKPLPGKPCVSRLRETIASWDHTDPRDSALQTSASQTPAAPA